MTGQEHYREAERLLAEGGNSGHIDMAVQAAQVHATLALAAAVKAQSNPRKAAIAIVHSIQDAQKTARRRAQR